MAKDPYRFFRVEARDLLRQMGEAVLEAEQGTGSGGDLPAQMLRLAHTLKGAASVVRQPGIAGQAHAIEELLTPLRDSGTAASRDDLDALLALIDEATRAVALLDPGAARPAAPPPLTAPAAVPQATDPPLPDSTSPEDASAPLFDIPLLAPEELDAMLAGIDQTQGQLAPIQRAAALLNELRGTLAAGQETLSAPLARIGDQLERGMRQLSRELMDLRDSAEQLRLQPAALLFGPLQRTARDAGRAQSKQLQFHGHGGQVKLEGALLNAVQGALVQMIRNAVAHGIELPEQRTAAGKPAQGRITLTVERRGRDVLFSCADDGAGVDFEAVRRKAKAKGVFDADALDDDALVDRLLLGGLSTARQVDALAGRGVGMDLVRETASRLGGRLTLRSERGQGTTVDLSVPLQLAALRALHVRSGDTWAWIPLEAIQCVLQSPVLHGRHIAVGDELLPHLSLADVLTPGAPVRPTPSVLVLKSRGQRAALGVEALDGVSSVVLRPPPALLPESPLIAGLALDAARQPVPVLSPDGLIDLARHTRARQAPPAPARTSTILVIDDSLTTRMLEQSILEAAGYRVHMAACAEDGLEAARRERYALILVDVEMPPGMDGFEFVTRLRADPALRDIPAVLVSSRNAPEDFARGQAAGADGYIVKGEFAQTEFLSQVARLVARSNERAQGAEA
ncbi:MAG: response regulator [Burkholderiaceae bacterium]